MIGIVVYRSFIGKSFFFFLWTESICNEEVQPLEKYFGWNKIGWLLFEKAFRKRELLIKVLPVKGLKQNLSVENGFRSLKYMISFEVI